MIFAIYYTRVGKPFLNKFTEFFPNLKDDLDKRFPDNVDNEISLCFQSIKRFHPEARLVLLTDQKTPVQTLEDVEVVRYDVDPEQPAYMRLKAQRQFLLSVTTSEPIVFCDYDLLYQDSIDPLFNNDFDLAFVYRKAYHGSAHPAPLNGGFMGIHSKSLAKAIHFLEAIHSYYLKHFPGYKEWGGYQASLNEFIGAENIHNAFPNPVTVDGIRILLLPSTKYNYAIETETGIIDFKPEKKILHFKGARKEAMADYWNTYLA